MIIDSGLLFGPPCILAMWCRCVVYFAGQESDQTLTVLIKVHRSLLMRCVPMKS